ncbi:dihydrofolate reductase family protein [Actinomadura kijaniata]|uniref:dihydrofolate reductase family protein n=1 Tax=Actinomadura kijaniata TaxID=46161 RepID=UPI000829DF5B|nr:dihydrofolate reductase family protein [Actinomadura kijaniata]
MRKLVYPIGVTIDGYIAGPDGDLGFFPIDADVVTFLAERHPDTLPSALRERLGIAGGPRRFDTAVMGRGAYEPGVRAGVGSPYAHLRQYVVSTTLGDSPHPDVRVVADDPVGWMRRLKADGGKDIYLVGGGRLAGTLLEEIDEIVLKVYPVVAGNGIRAFDGRFSPAGFRLAGGETVRGGMAVFTYVRDAGPEAGPSSP